MLEVLIRGRHDDLPLISIQPPMSDVSNGTPVDEIDCSDMDACYETFDKDGDGKLNLDEFRLICKALFRNDKGHIYTLPEEKARHVFQVFDKNGDGFIDKEEFTFCWNHWIKVIVRPISAFLIVDVQNDFISGTLNISKCNAQHDGSESSKAAPMTKDETMLLVQLVAASEIINNKATNATNNKLKDQAWQALAINFNSSVSSSQRTPAQLRLKWENLKKAARKRCANMRISRNKVVEPINRLLESVPFDCVFYSLDWHPSDHVSFIDNIHMRELHPSSPVSADKAQAYDTVVFAGPPLMKQRLWPRHCVQDTWGAELHKDLKIMEGAVKIYKGTNPEVDSYSVFWDNKKLTDTTLSTQLRLRNATDIYICGLAYDVCVGATIADALAIGYRAILIDDASRGVDLADIEKTKSTIINNSGVIVNSDDVLSMVEGRDRRPELGYKLAMELKNAMEDDGATPNTV